MLLQLVRDIGIRDWVRGMMVEAWLGRNPSTRFLRQDLDSALHASISHLLAENYPTDVSAVTIL